MNHLIDETSLQFLKDLGIKTQDKNLSANCPNSFYVEETLRLKKGTLSKDGALLVETGEFTGRAAKDKYVVFSKTTEEHIWWDNNVKKFTPEKFKTLKNEVLEYLDTKGDLYVTERTVGAHATHNVSARLVTPSPSHALFSNHMFREKLRAWDGGKDFTILHAPELKVDSTKYDTRSGTVIVTCFDTNTVIVVGTLYSGEIKKSIFSIMNYVLPDSGLLPMHAGANKGEKDTSVFFGLSGTGKTTLSTDEGKMLIGDDEHGLSDEGIFNFEGGCYAKTIKLSATAEPGIHAATNRFGALVENVVMDPKTRTFDFYDDSITENGRASYPLSYINEVEPSAKGAIPTNIFFLTADAFGVLPPVSKLTHSQAMFYFVLGYTAKLAGTEAGVTEPEATFSPCFGAPFMMRHPSTYADLLKHYIEKYDIQVWLINTGWTGGPHGVGERYPIQLTREIIRSVQADKLKTVPTEVDPIFNLHIPTEIPGFSSDMLFPKKNWKAKTPFEETAQGLAKSFHDQMKKFGDFYTEISESGPNFGR